MHVISREYWFSAAHQLEGHPKCGRLHGHNYRVVVVVTSPVLKGGMIMDYGQMDLTIKPIIDGRLDHRYLVSKDNIRAKNPVVVHGVQEHFIWLPIEHSTAEEIAKWLADQIQAVLPDGVRLLEVRVEETPKSTATFFPSA